MPEDHGTGKLRSGLPAASGLSEVSESTAPISVLAEPWSAETRAHDSNHYNIPPLFVSTRHRIRKGSRVGRKGSQEGRSVMKRRGIRHFPRRSKHELC